MRFEDCKIGLKVKILRKFNTYGDSPGWPDEMDETIGKTGIILSTHGYNRVRIQFQDSYSWTYTCEVLELIVKPIEKTYQDTEILTDNTILLNSVYTCDDCGEIILFPRYIYDTNQEITISLCNTCFNTIQYCSDCGGVILSYEDNFTTAGDKVICNSCYEEDYFTCSHCEQIYKNDDELNEFEDKKYCNDCFTEIFSECHNCGEIFERDELNGNDISDYLYCNDCYSEVFTDCEDCSTEIFQEDNYSSEFEAYLCSNCYEERREEADSRNIRIHEYGYSPSLNFYTCDSILSSDKIQKNLFMGIELEVDGDNIDNSEFLEENEDFIKEMPIYLCRDGSLDNGFEIITHPCTLNYHKKKIEYEEFFDKLKKASYKSHNYKTCGLHVHINKSYLGDTTEEIDVNISKILIFYERNWNNIIKFSRRTKDQYNHWCKNYCKTANNQEEITDLLNTAKRSDRYYAVNLNNSKTVEFRIFRGTLIYNTFLASLEFVHSTVNFIKEIPLEEHYKINWIEYIKYVESKNQYGKYQELINYMGEKGLIEVVEDSKLITLEV